ncbi:MAG: hypothetical protein ACRD29_07455 [Acidimicrobiales bacterium]
MTHRPTIRVSRRTFLAGTASAAFLAACGGGDESSTTASTTSIPTPRSSLVKFFGDDLLVAGVPQRATFGLGDGEGVVTTDVPPALDIALLDNGVETGPPTNVESRRDGIPRPYFALPFTVERPGVYTAVIEHDGEQVESSFQVNAPGDVRVPQVGQPMVAFDTPTAADGRSVTPICTREPVCPLHDVTLSQALGEGRPVAFIISTPRYCQVEICGPVLDVLLAQQAAFPDVRMVHAEVWAQPEAEPVPQTVAPVVAAYGLTYEPVLFLANRDGTIGARLDNIFDTTELVTALTELA